MVSFVQMQDIRTGYLSSLAFGTPSLAFIYFLLLHEVAFSLSSLSLSITERVVILT